MLIFSKLKRGAFPNSFGAMSFDDNYNETYLYKFSQMRSDAYRMVLKVALLKFQYRLGSKSFLFRIYSLYFDKVLAIHAQKHALRLITTAVLSLWFSVPYARHLL
jgi:hypothetical protein